MRSAERPDHRVASPREPRRGAARGPDPGEHAPQRGEDVIRGRGAVDDDPPVRLRDREREIRGANALVERAIEVRLEPGGLGGRLAGQPHLDRDIDEDRPVGPQAARGEPHHGAELIERQLAPAALVGERGVRVPIGDHEGAPTERRPDHLVDELDARGAEEERVRALGQADPDRAGVHEDRPDALAGGRPARLPDQHHVLARGGRGLPEPLGLGGLAAAFGALEGHEPALRPSPAFLHDRSVPRPATDSSLRAAAAQIVPTPPRRGSSAGRGADERRDAMKAARGVDRGPGRRDEAGPSRRLRPGWRAKPGCRGASALPGRSPLPSSCSQSSQQSRSRIRSATSRSTTTPGSGSAGTPCSSTSCSIGPRSRPSRRCAGSTRTATARSIRARRRHSAARSASPRRRSSTCGSGHPGRPSS